MTLWYLGFSRRRAADQGPPWNSLPAGQLELVPIASVTHHGPVMCLRHSSAAGGRPMGVEDQQRARRRRNKLNGSSELARRTRGAHLRELAKTGKAKAGMWVTHAWID